ncbi:uncharacterized protein LOC130979431 [Arachis stenosperma]|uniref:uncharacterized protein LOC130979431 n=1 Tax=Arachis stenosperma TaxID=217475 RepID=UPI0025ABD211|nr:uncharacterized protein LOC130979431 [Arachis stenosperma]
MADNGIQQPSQAELLAMIAKLHNEVRKIAEQSSKSPGGNSSHAREAEPLEITPPKEKLTLDNPFSEGGASDPILCRSFPTYLDGTALLWFSKIPASSISSFEDLARSFIEYFAALRIYVQGSDYLSTIKQGQHESLKDYMTRFAKATVEIPDLDPKVSSNRTATIHSDQTEARRCYNESLKNKSENNSKIELPKETYQVANISGTADLDPREDMQNRPSPTDDLEKVMPFGLKNASAIYQRLMDKVFRKQFGRNLEVYVDDMVVKIKQPQDHEDNLEEIFEQVRKHNMRLNPGKCAFGVTGDKFLDFMLTSRGVKANPKKCKAII